MSESMREVWGRRDPGDEPPEESGLEPLVELRGVQKNYQRGPEKIHALRDVSVRLFPGDMLALVGPSGSGKTTLLNVLCGWEEPDAGQVAWHDGLTIPARARQWSDIAILPQDLGLLEELSVRENVALPLRLTRGPTSPDSLDPDDLLREFGLAGYADRSPNEMSLGEQQRAALSRALVVRPKLLLADEPSAHQDAGWAEAVFGALRNAAATGVCCLVATHNEEFLRHASRLLTMRDGEVQETSPRVRG